MGKVAWLALPTLRRRLRKLGRDGSGPPMYHSPGIPVTQRCCSDSAELLRNSTGKRPSPDHGGVTAEPSRATYCNRFHWAGRSGNARASNCLPISRCSRSAERRRRLESFTVLRNIALGSRMTIFRAPRRPVRANRRLKTLMLGARFTGWSGNNMSRHSASHQRELRVRRHALETARQPL